MRGGWCVGRGRRPRFHNVATQIEPRSTSSRARRGRRAQAAGSYRRRAAHQARIRPCGPPPVGIRTSRNRPVTTKWRHTASGRVRLHTPPASGGPLTARSPKMAAGHRAGRSRATPSQWSRSEVSSHDIKQNMCVVSARISIRGRRADRPRSGPLILFAPCPRRVGRGSKSWQRSPIFFCLCP